MVVLENMACMQCWLMLKVRSENRKGMQEFGQVDGIISFWELSQPLVARLAEQLALPGNPPHAVDNARDKQVLP